MLQLYTVNRMALAIISTDPRKGIDSVEEYQLGQLGVDACSTFFYLRSHSGAAFKKLRLV